MKSSSDIFQHLQWHMDAWEAGQYLMLIQATEQDMQYFLTTCPSTWYHLCPMASDLPL